MSKTYRRILYLSFFLFFLVFSGSFIFYSLGYRYNFDNQSLEKNGAFFIKSYPRSAEIWLDGNKTRSRTPNQLVNVRPGQHEILVTKEGYLPWQKKLEVNSGQTTFAEEISLFFEQRPKQLLSEGSEKYLINQANNRYAFLIDQNLWIVNTENAKAFDVYQLTGDIELIDWSPDNQKILLKQNNQYQILEINQLKIKNLTLSLVDKVSWDNEDNNFLWYLFNGTLYRYNLTMETATAKITEVDDFDLSGNFIATQTKNDNQNIIIQYQKDTGTQIRQLTGINSNKINLVLANNDYLIFQAGSKIYIKQKDQDLLDFPATLVKIYGRYLLISDSHEIWLYDYHDNWKEILDRSSSIVADIVWHPNGSYYLNEINGQTNLYELDGRDYRNYINLIDDPLKKMYLFNHDGSKLFVLTPEENYYLEIQ